MRLRAPVALLEVVAFLCACASCAPIAELQPEQPARVRIGDLAASHVDSDRQYAVGSAGNSIRLIKRAEEGERPFTFTELSLLATTHSS